MTYRIVPISAFTGATADALTLRLDPGVSEDRVEQRRVLAVVVADEEPGPAAGVL